MKKVLDSVIHVFDETTGLISEGYDSALALLRETLTNFYDVKNLTGDRLTAFTNELIELSPIIDKTGYRTKEINIGISLPPRIVFHFIKFKEVSNVEIDIILKENEDKKLLKVIVNTLLAADDFQRKLTLSHFKFSEIDIELGMPPEVNVKFVNTSDTETV